MANDSSTGGILLPAPPPPLDDATLDAVFQGLVTSITGLAGNLVVPRWQPIVPKQPAASVNWCAIGVMSATVDDSPSLTYDPINNCVIYLRSESIEVDATFYGPNSKQYAAQFRDGLAVNQNMDGLLAYSMRFTRVGTIRSAPEFDNQTWVKRQDIEATFARRVSRTYPILSYLSADVQLIDDSGAINVTFIVPPQPSKPIVTNLGVPIQTNSGQDILATP